MEPSRLLARTSIKWLMPPLLVLPVVVVATVLTVLAYTTGLRSADDLANQNMEQIHSRIEEHLTRLLDMPPAINELNKRMLATGQLSLEDVDRDRVPVFETLNIFTAVSSIVIGKATGQAMWVIRYPGETTYEYAIKRTPDAKMEEYPLGDAGQIAGDRLSQYEFHPTLRPWYKAAIAADGPTWGEVYVWVRNGRGETLGVPYVEPCRDAQGRIVGVINCELTLADISAFLGRLKVGKTGTAFIVERDGDLVANSVSLDCMKDGLHRLPGAEATHACIAQASRYLADRFGSPLKISERQREAVEIDGQPMRLVVSPYRNRRNLDWLIVTLVPDADFLADIERSRATSTMIGLAAFVLMLALSVFTVMKLMRSFLALVAHVRRVGEGELDERIYLTDSLEMTQLSSAINDMVDDLQDHVRLRHSLALAMDVQQNLLPSGSPSIEGLDVAGHSTYCDETGGDYYDFLEVIGLSKSAVAVALGDVMGHGVAAAMLMATARGILRSRCRQPGTLAELLTHMNDLLVDDTGGERFMTMLLMTIDVESGHMTWASAGHDPPIIYDTTSGEFVEREGGGLPLGVSEDETYEEHASADVRPGQIYLASTDGLWEAANSEGEIFGKDRLRDAIRRSADLPAEDMAKAIRDELARFRGDASQDDDITFVIVKAT